METTRTTNLDSRIGNLVETTQAGHERSERPIDAGSEWSARPLRPVAHWVLMPMSGGRNRLEMVWEVPDPMPLDATA
jgi:hypothetical protein